MSKSVSETSHECVWFGIAWHSLALRSAVCRGYHPTTVWMGANSHRVADLSNGSTSTLKHSREMRIKLECARCFSREPTTSSHCRAGSHRRPNRNPRNNPEIPRAKRLSITLHSFMAVLKLTTTYVWNAIYKTFFWTSSTLDVAGILSTLH